MTIAAISDWLNISMQSARLAAAAGVLILCWVLYLIARHILLKIIDKVVEKTKTYWDDVLRKHKVFRRMVLVVPVLTLWFFVGLFPGAQAFIQKLCISLIVMIGVSAFNGVLSSIEEIYGELPVSRERPIKGFIQIIKLILIIFSLFVIVGVLIDRSPIYLLSGLGAMTAILLLIFKDTILSFVASVRISTNGLIKIGDWISYPQHDADGEVIDLALHSIRIRNWDKTITTIPMHKLLEESFKNWQGMVETGGRRIKRSLSIDMNSVRFLDDELLEKLSKIRLLESYVKEKQAEIEAFNRELEKEGKIGSSRRMTNFGTFRAYIAAYLRSLPTIRKDMTFLIRHLDPTPKGIPLEVYVFTATTEWGAYEAIQADIFDHLLAIISEFDLRVFQEPSGWDWREK